MEFQDRQISCVDCGQPFVFTAGEQEFYERKGFKEEPKRCKPCREARKTRRGSQGDGYASGNGGGGSYGGGGYGGNSYGGGGGYDDDSFGNRAPAPRGARGGGNGNRGPRGGGGGGGFGGGGGGEREMFDATCAQCGTATRVPFRPVAGRPVYCRECYGSRRAGGAP